MGAVDNRTEIEQVVRDYERCVNQGNLDELLALFTEDAVFYDPVGWMDEFADVAEPQPDGLQPAFIGRDNLIQFFTRVGQAFPGLQFTVKWIFVSESPPGAAFEWHGYSERGGQVLEVRAVDVFEITNGKITAVRGYIANPDTFVYKDAT
jgi:ketosteroid isomerase-like protein